jgi:hypothetical protein
MIRENIKISAKEGLGFMKHKPWFDKACSELLDQRKQAKLKWLPYQGEISGDNLNSVRCEDNRHFRNKRKEYLKDKINELAKNTVRTKTSEICIEE